MFEASQNWIKSQIRTDEWREEFEIFRFMRWGFQYW